MRSLDPGVADWAVAVAFMVAFAIEAVVFADGNAGRLAVAAVCVAATATLALRRRSPLVPALALAAVYLLAAFTAPFILTVLTAPFLASMVLLYSLGRHERGVATAVALLASLALASAVAGTFEQPFQLLWLGVVGGGPFLVGRAMRNRRRLQAELRERTLQLERDRALRSERAAEDERARLATELQAAIANGVSTMVVQAEVVPRSIAAGDIEGAGTAFAVIEETGRGSLAEMRRLLGILRRGEDGPALAPQPTLAEIERLADRVRGQGLEVDLSYEGDPVELTPGADLVAYRVMQEALDAAASADATMARVVVGYEPGELRLEVRDDRAGTAVESEPLLAMRERLGLYGGRLRTGVDELGRYRVLAILPVNGAGS